MLYSTGSFFGTGSDLTVDKVGFRPKVVKVYNADGNCFAIHTELMDPDSMQKTVDSGSGATDISLVSSNGITLRTNGFALGADSDLNAVGEECLYECYQ